MSAIQRLTFISDPTDEFPKNANNSFKVRLPEHLSLPGSGWHAALMTLTVPDRGQSYAVIASDPKTKLIRFQFLCLARTSTSSGYNDASIETVVCELELEKIMNASYAVTDEMMFWQRVIQEMYNTIMEKTIVKRDEWQTFTNLRAVVSAIQNGMPRLTWENDMVRIHSIPETSLLKANKTPWVTFEINLDLAIKFGLVIDKSTSTKTNYLLGPNFTYTLPVVKYNAQTTPTGSDHRSPYNWEGKQFVSQKHGVDLFNVVSHGGVKFLKLSLLVEWQLNHLNPAFEKMVGTRKHTVMVYSDLVESTVVGSGKFPLLREVQLLRTGDGESTAEPLHHQWIKVRGNQMEILEVEIASTAGPLAILPPGKTLVTIGLKRL